MECFAVIDTETTWSNSLMTAGILIVEKGTFKIVDYRYYVVKEALDEGGMFSYCAHLKGIAEEIYSEKIIGDVITRYLKARGIMSIFAYNAGFDKRLLPFLDVFKWHDIMQLAAYKQYNPMIPEKEECFKTGKLKRGYGVENILRMLGRKRYVETHHALIDAKDELEIMQRLGHELELYPQI